MLLLYESMRHKGSNNYCHWMICAVQAESFEILDGEIAVVRSEWLSLVTSLTALGLDHRHGK